MVQRVKGVEHHIDLVFTLFELGDLNMKTHSSETSELKHITLDSWKKKQSDIFMSPWCTVNL